MTAPLNSVIVPVLNGTRYIAACICSILPELHHNDELIIVDNGSVDGTPALVAAIGDNRIVLLHQPRRGAAAARNLGIERAKGRYIAFQDHDDLWPAGRQSALLAAIQDTPGANAAHGRARVIFEGGIDPRYAAMNGQHAAHHSLMTSLFERALIERTGLMDETLSLAEDVDYLIRLKAAGMVSVACDAEVHIRRRHDTNTTLFDTTPVAAQMMQVLRRNILRKRGTP